MKIGFLVECSRQGAETQVLPYLAKKIREDIEPDIIPLDKKPILKRDCGEFTRKLLEEGCRIVLIVWDLLPDWQEYEGKGCQHDDRMEIFSSLKAAGLKPGDKRIRLICIHKMLEAWIMAEERAISSFLFTAAHTVSLRKQRDPENIRDPKAALNRIFRQSKSPHRIYVDWDHAFKILKKADLNRLRRCNSFRRFEEKLTSAK
jgi:hypothetical protein